MFTGAACPGHIHLCANFNQRTQAEYWLSKRIILKKNASMDVQEAFSYDFPLH